MLSSLVNLSLLIISLDKAGVWGRESQQQQHRRSRTAREGAEQQQCLRAASVSRLPIPLLEKERREWQAERLKLVHCIHLQQLELSQRAAAAHDRATDIAKDFARVIEGFEERLVAVETNVQTELLALKKIAEQIRTAVAPGATGSRPMT